MAELDSLERGFLSCLECLGASLDVVVRPGVWLIWGWFEWGIRFVGRFCDKREKEDEEGDSVLGVDMLMKLI